MKPSLRYYNYTRNEYIDVPQPEARKYLTIERKTGAFLLHIAINFEIFIFYFVCVTECLVSKLPTRVPSDATKGYDGSSPPKGWLKPHGHGGGIHARMD